MYLSRVRLDRSDPGIRQCMRDGQDMHRSIMKMFNGSRNDEKVLYRLSPEKMSLYIMSENEPRQAVRGMTVTGSKDLSDIGKHITKGSTLCFDMLVSPCKKVRQEGLKNSRRRFLRTPEERTEWIMKKAELNGFRVNTYQEQESPRIFCRHGAQDGGEMYLNAVKYSGTLTVTDVEKFINALSSGIGSGRAYGLGMLLVGNPQ